MDILFDKAKWLKDSDGTWLLIKPSAPSQALEFCQEMKDIKYVAELKEYRVKRSLSANDYLWVLCQKIAEIIKSTKNEVYIESIRAKGQFTTLTIGREAAETFIKKWAMRGLGWYAELVDGQDEENIQVIAYYGSSVYDSREMAVLLDYIIQEAQYLGIETAAPNELLRMKQQWNV